MDMQNFAADYENVDSDNMDDDNSDTDFILMTLDNEDLEFNTSTSRNTVWNDGAVSTALYNKYPSIGDVSVSITDVSHFESSNYSVPYHHLNIDGRDYAAFNKNTWVVEDNIFRIKIFFFNIFF